MQNAADYESMMGALDRLIRGRSHCKQILEEMGRIFATGTNYLGEKEHVLKFMSGPELSKEGPCSSKVREVLFNAMSMCGLGLWCGQVAMTLYARRTGENGLVHGGPRGSLEENGSAGVEAVAFLGLIGGYLQECLGDGQYIRFHACIAECEIAGSVYPAAARKISGDRLLTEATLYFLHKEDIAVGCMLPVSLYLERYPCAGNCDKKGVLKYVRTVALSRYAEALVGCIDASAMANRGGSSDVLPHFLQRIWEEARCVRKMLASDAQDHPYSDMGAFRRSLADLVEALEERSRAELGRAGIGQLQGQRIVGLIDNKVRSQMEMQS